MMNGEKMTRANSHIELYGSDWKKARARYLRQNPFCIDCQKIGRVVKATYLDHITPHQGDLVLFWDENNWQGLCHSCHSRKTAREDGGFGNRKGNKSSASCGLDGLPIDNNHHWNKGGR